jgi:exodeoxyribonuclease VII large subunit
VNLFPESPPVGDRRKIYPVSEIARLIKTVLENEIGAVWIEGEISGLRRPASGHLYFDLKDSDALINAVLFRGSQTGLRVALENGAKVRVLGEITSYPPRSSYQVLVRKVEAAGKGSLQEQFEKLKEGLAKEGLFDAARKRPLPLLPRHIGIVTSPTGAAIRDILNILERRFPNLHILIAPVKVQGEGAAAEIARAIDDLNARGNLDVLIVGRGGGSLEDLWAFNEEVVARAMVRSRIPVISAVGHEIDFTISDFVADLRAPTPSAAAELVVRAKADFEEVINTHRRRLSRALQTEVLSLRNRLTRASRSYVFREPHHLVQRIRERLDSLGQTMAGCLRETFTGTQQRIDEATMRMGYRARIATQACSADLQRLSSHLQSLNPTAVLQRGYSISTINGRVLRRAEDAAPGILLETRLASGSVRSRVTETR